MAANETRMEAARRRIRIARYSIGAVAAAAFALFGFAVRDAHPATHADNSSATTSNVSTSDDDTFSDDNSFSFDGGGSIGSSDSFSAPSVQSGGS